MPRQVWAWSEDRPVRPGHPRDLVQLHPGRELLGPDRVLRQRHDHRVLPAEVEVTALPASNNQWTVDYDAATRTLTVDFIIPLAAPNPPGSVGLPDGSPLNIELGVRIPANSPDTDGTVITNTGMLNADNATPVHQHRHRHGFRPAGGHTGGDEVLE